MPALRSAITLSLSIVVILTAAACVTTVAPAPTPTVAPTPATAPTATPTAVPTAAPTAAPTDAPTDAPTEAPTEAPTPTKAPIATPTATAPPTGAPEPTPTTDPWVRHAVEHRESQGETFDYECSPNGTERTVWGTDLYTDDSSVCTAAVHAGLITFESGGRVTIRITGPQEAFEGSERNGVTSLPYGTWGGSFEFVVLEALSRG